MPEFLRNLSPRARLTIGAAVAALAAIIIVRGRATDPAARQDGAAVGPMASPTTSDVPATPYMPSSTFAENGAAMGDLSTTLTGLRYDLQAATQAQYDTQEAIAAVQPAAVAAAPPVVVNVQASPAKTKTVGGKKTSHGHGGKPSHHKPSSGRSSSSTAKNPSKTKAKRH